MKRHRSGVVSVLAMACLGLSCAPHPKTAPEGETAKTVSAPAATTAGSVTTPGSGDPGAGCPQGCDTPPAGCVIKGNINVKTGDRVYHLPGQIHYDNVTIEPERGEKWFCSESEAQANGWRRARK